jgi:hypothetical protein
VPEYLSRREWRGRRERAAFAVSVRGPRRQRLVVFVEDVQGLLGQAQLRAEVGVDVVEAFRLLPFLLRAVFGRRRRRREGSFSSTVRHGEEVEGC